MRTMLRALAVLTAGLAGCTSFNPDDPFAAFRRADPRFDPTSAPTANTQAATRADAVGSALIAQCRSDLPGKPVIMTIGYKEPMIFHDRTGMLVLSDGLVDRCASDDELAAVMAYELGKVAAEHSEKFAPRGELDAPPAPRLSQDVVGGGYSADMTRLAEEAKFDTRAPRPRSAREPRPDARTLGQNLFIKAGHNADDFARVESLVKEAEENGEKREVMKRK